MKKNFTIGKLAKKANVNLETIRYYQRKGLLEKPEKPPNGYRIYPESTIDKLNFIKRAKQLGFTLSEISLLMDLDNESCSDVKNLAENKLKIINSKINDLTLIKNALKKSIKACEVNEQNLDCPIISSLTQD